MLNIFNKEYYIDIDKAITSCQLMETNKLTEKNNFDVDEIDDDIDEEEYDPNDIQINIFKFDIIKMCIDRVLNNYEDNDEISTLYTENKSFKIALATLIKNKILIELEDEDEFE